MHEDKKTSASVLGMIGFVAIVVVAAVWQGISREMIPWGLEEFFFGVGVLAAIACAAALYALGTLALDRIRGG